MKLKKKDMFLNCIWYMYIFRLFFISKAFRDKFDIIFSALFFTVVTVNSLSSYYITNKNLESIKADKLIALTIPLSFLFMIVLAMFLNILVKL